jgi:hypothetical protein
MGVLAEGFGCSADLHGIRIATEYAEDLLFEVIRYEETDLLLGQVHAIYLLRVPVMSCLPGAWSR